jgi:hypothetical protein
MTGAAADDAVQATVEEADQANVFFPAAREDRPQR